MILKNSPTFKYLKITAIIFCLFISFSVPKQTQALADYKVLVPLPGIGDKDGKTNLNTWLPAAFNLTVAISVAMAFVMITFGGVLYATSDAINDKGKGKQYIENALTGLLFVIGAYVILNTINPKLVKIDLSIEPPKPLEGASVVIGGPTTNVVGSGLSEGAVRNQLSSANFSYASECAPGTSTGCVNLAGITLDTIYSLQKLQKDCGCTIRITGGTEAAHEPGSAHYRGVAVDIGYTSETIALAKKTNPNYTQCTPFAVRGGSGANSYNATFMFEPKGVACGKVPSSGDHWHVSF